MTKLALYLHVPFCLKKCPYCSFYSIPLKPENIPENIYLKTIKTELLLLRDFLFHRFKINKIHFITFYAGGGTPSLLSPLFYENLFNFLSKHFDFSPVELTLEANPETLDLTKLKDFYKIGINRISIGIQSMSQRGLNFLQRIHTVKTSVRTVKYAIKAGFTNISLDFMFGWKGQGEKTLAKEIQKALKLSPTHLSFYELTIEKNTLFYSLYKKKTWLKEEKLESLYRIIEEILETNGYHRYEISNYAIPGYECRHNLIYWKVKPYLGLGPSAVSRIEHLRWQNPEDLSLYTQSILKDKKLSLKIIETLDKFEFAKEYIFMGLRLKTGISLKILEKKYKAKLDRDMIKKLILQGFLTENKQKLALTFKGKLLHNQVVSFLWEGLHCA